MGEELGGGFTLIVVIFLLILAILWFILPFAIFGTKPILREILDLQREQTELLEELVAQTSSELHAPTPGIRPAKRE